MRFLVTAILILGAGAANSAMVTITFDDPATETYSTFFDPYVGDNVDIVDKGGFRVAAFGVDGSPGDRDAAAIAWILDGYTRDYPVTLSRIDGGAFNLHAFDAEDLDYFSYSLADGSYGAASDLAELPGGVLSNVTSVQFNAFYTFYGAAKVDNIVVSAVPVPAAVWMFGSGLGLLGWFRAARKPDSA